MRFKLTDFLTTTRSLPTRCTESVHQMYVMAAVKWWVAPLVGSLPRIYSQYSCHVSKVFCSRLFGYKILHTILYTEQIAMLFCLNLELPPVKLGEKLYTSLLSGGIMQITIIAAWLIASVVGVNRLVTSVVFVWIGWSLQSCLSLSE